MMDERSASTDLPWRYANDGLRKPFLGGFWYPGVVLEDNPTVRVDEQWCPRFEEYLPYPKVIIDPIVR